MTQCLSYCLPLSFGCHQVTFQHPFNPKDSMGCVERWLIECEIAMRGTVKEVTHQAFNAYATNPRIE